MATGGKANRKWIWFFVILAVLAALAIGINWVRNANQQLTAEQLQAARELWRRNRPADYDLKIVNAIQKQTITVHVRGTTIVEFLVNGKPPEPLLDRDGKPNPEAERAQRQYYDMDGLFDSVEELLERDRRENRYPFTRARFDKNDGHITSFIRQYQGVTEQSFRVELTRPSS